MTIGDIVNLVAGTVDIVCMVQWLRRRIHNQATRVRFLGRPPPNTPGLIKLVAALFWGGECKAVMEMGQVPPILWSLLKRGGSETCLSPTTLTPLRVVEQPVCFAP